MTYFGWLAIVIFVVGIVVKFVAWLKTPNPLNIPTQPAPIDTGGVVVRMLKEVFLFDSLRKADKYLWAGGLIFHVSFLIIIIRHLRYFIYPVPGLIVALEPLGILAGFTMALSLGFLFFRRIVNDRNFYISSFMDYAILMLILLIGITGITMQYVHRPMLVDIKAFTLGLVHLDPAATPGDVMFLIHFVLVMLLLIYFPFSKLLHAPGVFLSPTRALPDNPREQRHVNPWDKS